MWTADAPSILEPTWLVLPVLGGLLLAATSFIVVFRYGRSFDAVNLVEAALAPLLVAFPPIAVVAVVALAQVGNGLLHRLPWIKTAHNVAMWSLATAAATAVLDAIVVTPSPSTLLLGLVAALAVVGVINNLSVAVVLTLAEQEPLGRMGLRFIDLTRPAWLAAWVFNAAVGVLFVLAYLTSPFASLLFFVPLLVLHLSYRSYSAARADQERLTAAHNAAVHLATRLEPLAAVPDFLRDVADCFEAATVELVLRDADGDRDIHRVDRATGRYAQRTEEGGTASLAGALVSTPGAVHLVHGRDPVMSGLLEAAGARDCLAAPLRDGDRLIGAVLVLDRYGFAGSREGQLAVLESLARETTAALEKGRLLASVMDERRKLSQIVDSASDGICLVASDGTVLSWNPALERLSGLGRDDAVGFTDVWARLRMRTADGEPVELAGAATAARPSDVYITTVDGKKRHLTCSYSVERAAHTDALVVVARDVTIAEEHEALREEFSRLAAAEAAQRAMVEQLQQAVVPPPLAIPGGHIAAAYEASEPTEPTGGDLYDWQVLPSGEIHIAVVDVLGHGLSATKDALAVIHTLRVVTAAGTALGDVVAQADALLSAQHPDLVATAIVARYDPQTGRLRVASGGHPPAMIVTPGRRVRQVPASGGVIGWPGAGSDGVSETLLQPGDSLILYTDGLVEARKNILDGIEDLERHAAEVADLSAEQLAGELVRRALAGADRRDDTLALVLRREFVPAALERTSWSIGPEPADARAVRHELASWLRDRQAQEPDVLTVAGELLANAVRSARSRVAVHVKVTAERVILDVSDDGVAPADIADIGTTLPAPDAERGRGLYIVRALAEDVSVLATEEMTMIRATLTRQRRRASRPATAEWTPTV